MQRTNRLFAIAFAVICLVLALGAAAFVLSLPGPYILTAYNGLEYRFDPFTTQDKLVAIATSLTVVVAALLLLALETLGPPREHRLRIRAGSPADTWITVTSAEHHLVTVLRAIDGVSSAAVRLVPKRAQPEVDVLVTLATLQGSAVPAVCEQGVARVHEALERDLGLTVGNVSVMVRHGSETVQAVSLEKD
ncbi:MAG: alkaline shock response membrane anchor protein AmaP [Chloroflexi bacterium]|nr:alkaline shock response membrane anchor protein AmaP [Chloroflexota bacterium]